MVKHWLIRIGDGTNFWNSSKYYIWSANTKTPDDKYFLEHAAAGDILWFVTNKSSGHLVAVSVYEKRVARVPGPLLALTRTDEELGWDEEGAKYDTEIHYSDLINISSLNLRSRINSPKVKRVYNPDKCAVDLPSEFVLIQRYKNIRPVELGADNAPVLAAAADEHDTDD